MNNLYRSQVALLLRIMPSVFKIDDFAVHGGTALNLFHRDMPRYSVDIDITYIPLESREQSISKINGNLLVLKSLIEKSVPGIKVVHKPDVWKLMCTKDTANVKIEVNGTKRGTVEPVEIKTLCEKAQKDFSMSCVARTVSFGQLYGGKIAAALGRQHPRDLFDCQDIDKETFGKVKNGFMLCLLGSDKPIIESLSPNLIDQNEALENQFEGMTDIPFSYADYEAARENLIKTVNESLDNDDRSFLLGFESGTPDWNLCSAGDLNVFPSIQWKLKNINVLKAKNADKFRTGIDRLEKFLLCRQ